MCAVEYEAKDRSGTADNVDCLMGRVSDSSRRFLDFYARRS